MTNKSWIITADVELTDDKTSGMVVTHGGLEGGYGLYFRDNKPTFVYNYLSIDRPTFIAKDPLPKGKTKLVVDFAYDGGGMGKGARSPCQPMVKKSLKAASKRPFPFSSRWAKDST
jgi:hypothetical protein